jgi:class 3 adenylate cyclase/YHS domain-containing protein
VEATFCFVDLAGFSALTEAHGDEAAADLALRFTGLVTETLAGHGRLVKTIGDAALVVSPSPPPAIRFVSGLWRRAAEEPDFPVLRAGLHHGEAVERGDDVFGSAVNLAARVAAEARGGQVLATARVGDAARSGGVSVTPLGTVTLRNVRQPVELFQLDFGLGGMPEVIDPVCRMRIASDSAPARLHLDGIDYWFCSARCLGLFAADPGAYRRSPA